MMQVVQVSISPTNRNSRNSRQTVPGGYIREAPGASWSTCWKYQRDTQLRDLQLLRITAVWIVRLLCDEILPWRDQEILDRAYSARRPSTLSVPSGGFGVWNCWFIGLI